MERITREDLRRALHAVGLRPGDVVFVYSDLRRPGALVGARSREEFCGAYLEALRDAVGPSGTVVVPTYTTQIARFDIDFVWESTPTTMGLFAEYVRTHRDSLRSVHPINSVAAIGAHREYLCVETGTSNFGWDSPFHRLLNVESAKILSIGLESGYAVGVAHHLESACALPYVYNKLLKWKPIVRGTRDTRDYFATLRYLDLGVRYNLTELVKQTRAKGLTRSARLGGAWVHCSSYRGAFEEGVRLLRNDPYCLLATRPTFEYGRIPFDGPTARRDGMFAAEAEVQRNWHGLYLLYQGYAGGDDHELMDHDRDQP